MDDELDSLVLRVRADTGGFARDIDAMRAELDGPLARGAASAGNAIENALTRAARTGKFGFDDLRRTALSVLGEIASNAIRANLGALGGGGGGAGGGLLGSLLGAATQFLGAPGRATGGPVVGGRPYVVGERGPELFVPTAAGRVSPMGSGGRGPVSITVNVAALAGASEGYMGRTGQQVARAVRAAMARADG